MKPGNATAKSAKTSKSKKLTISNTINHATMEKNNAPKPISENKLLTLISAGEEAKSPTLHRGDRRLRRNDPCPCGSGKKVKNCCGIHPEYKFDVYTPHVTRESEMKQFRKNIPFAVGEIVLASRAFPVEAFRGQELVIMERGIEERHGNFYFKVAPVSDPEHLVDTSLWYSDGHLVKPEHYDQD